MALVTPGALKNAFQPFLPVVAVVRFSPSQRGSPSNSGQRRRGRRELEQHGTRGNTLTAGSTLKVTPTFCYKERKLQSDSAQRGFIILFSLPY